MDLRHLTIPPHDSDVVIAGKPLGFLTIAEHVLNNDARFTRNARGMRDAVRILGKLEGAKVGDVITLDDADWRALHDAFEDPTDGYMPALSKVDTAGKPMTFKLPPKVILPFVEALSDANTKAAPKEAYPIAAEELPS
jgi:hypothetical protein